MSGTEQISNYDKKKVYIKEYYKRRYENDVLFRQKENNRIAERNKKNLENPEYRKKVNERAKQSRNETKMSILRLKELEKVLFEKGITV